MIERLWKDISDNELVIETLWKIIGDEDLIEWELMKVINKGPPRMRVPTWEELWMEIKKLKGWLGVKVSKDEKNADEDDEEKDKDDDILKENMSEVDGSLNGTGEFDDNRKWLEDSIKNLQMELWDKNELVLTQWEEIENLKVEIRARDMNINRQQRNIGELHEEIRDLKLLETELKQLLQKKMTLEE